jgi:hypothetical protein
MPDLIRRFRGLAVALVILALSAGAVFAATPVLRPTAVPQPQVEEVPSEDPSEEPSASPDEDGDEDTDDDADEDTDEDPSEEPSASPDEDGDEDADGPSDNHGAVVSAAAKAETPAGFKNHGQFVSCVAHMDVADPSTFDPATVTPEACGITPEEAKANGKDKAAEKKANGKDKAEAKRAKAEAKQAQHAKPLP